tara:strand:+ start:141 stop:890 length:750 start_codon:yes stop_codon:yes gene_type:complete
MSIPNKLYKYESFTTQSIANLKNGEIYFSLTSQFNDPFDCSLPIRFDLTLDNIDRFRDIFVELGRFPEQTIQQFNGMDNESLLQLLNETMKEALIEALKGKGVSCFSSENDNLLMWSHYGAKHTGFCLEFDTGKEPFSKARKVHYVDQFPELSAEEILTNINYESTLALLHTKSKMWKYESEWRCIHEESPKAFSYAQDSLTGVYFGSEMDITVIKIICVILQGQNPDVRFWRGKKCIDRFGIVFDEFF